MFKGIKPIIGMLHAPALPGSPSFSGNLKDLHEFVLKDAESLVSGGVDALMLENYGDLPFFPGKVPDSTVANLTFLARKVKNKFNLPLGINVLRNDGVSALAIAHAVGAQFVRINILSGARLTDQGIINGEAHEVLRFRKKIGATSIRVFADISVKCSAPLAERPLKNEVEETLQRSGAEGLIVSGENTGKPVDLNQLKEVKKLSKDTPVWIGSGTTAENIISLSRWADGFIVGSAFKEALSDPIDPKRVRNLVEKLKKAAKK
jgi:membrane complex biogenesis BtpA family protein